MRLQDTGGRGDENTARWSLAAAHCVLAAGLGELCARSRGSERCPIAFIDGKVRREHPLLLGAPVEILEPFEAELSESLAASQHATFIASIFSGAAPCLGLAPCSPLINIAVVDDDMLHGVIPPSTAAMRLAVAIQVAAARGSRIIQLSLNLSFDDAEARAIVAAVHAATTNDTVFIISTGQAQQWRGNPLVGLPGVLGVAGAGSPPAACIDVLAPLADIPGATIPTGVVLRSGVSFALCFVTAALALICATADVSPRTAAQGMRSRCRVAGLTLDAQELWTAFNFRENPS